MKIRFYLLVVFLVMALAHESEGQVSFSAQIRTRTEFRNGQGTPLPKEASPAFFTSQRTRLNAGYSGYRFKIYTSLQDVRVWGQDASSINRITSDPYDGLMLHEAWGEFSLVDTGRVI